MATSVWNTSKVGKTPIESERPRFAKNQIMCQSQIHKGLKVRICQHGKDGSPGVVVRGPYRECGKLRIDINFSKGRSVLQETILLEDHSVVRREDRSWENFKWLERG